jgi:hypothetical protein
LMAISRISETLLSMGGPPRFFTRIIVYLLYVIFF